MIIKISLTKQDWLFFNKYLQKKKQKETKSFSNSFIGNLLIFFVIGLAAMFFLDGQFHLPTAAATCLIFVMIVLQYSLNISKLRKALMPSESGVFVGQHAFEFGEEGISCSGKGYKSFHEWSIVKYLVFEEEYIMIFFDTAYAYIFPVNQIENLEEFKDILYKNRSINT